MRPPVGFGLLLTYTVGSSPGTVKVKCVTTAPTPAGWEGEESPGMGKHMLQPAFSLSPCPEQSVTPLL